MSLITPQKSSSTSSAGFTAVELLVTLFVAAAFLLAGYQLFNAVIADGGRTRARTTVSNVAYGYLQQYASTATNPCSTAMPASNLSITIPDIATPTLTVAISCPLGTSSSLSRVDVIIEYNNGADSIGQARYIDKS